MTKKEKQDCPGYYEVSEYTTDSGKKVDSYTRTCWKHGGGASGSGVQNTQESIDKTNEKLDEINNKEEITDEDLDLSKGYLSAAISKVCEDCENYMDEESENKVEIPTFESIEKSKDLQNTKNKILDNIENSMHTVNKIEKIQKKQWDTVNTKDNNYYDNLYEYAKSKETIDNINKNLRYLHQAVSNSWGIAKNFIGELKTLNNEITEQGIPTGYAANPISVKTAPFLNKKSNNYLTDINNVLKTNLSEFTIDSIFNLSNSIPNSDFNSYWGQVFWLYSKGQINIKSIPSNKNKIKEYNSIDDIKNIKLKKFVTKKLEKEMGINNCKGLVFFSNSDLARKFTESKDLQNYIKDYQNGKADNSIHFKINNGFDYFSTLGYAEVYNVEKLTNGDYEIVLVDTYDFNNNKNIINQMGYKLQKEKISNPFFSIIYIHVPQKIINS